MPPPPSTYKSISYSQLPCSLPLNLQIDQLFPPAVPPPSTYKSISYSQLPCSLPLNLQIDQLNLQIYQLLPAAVQLPPQPTNRSAFPTCCAPPPSTYKSVSYSQLPCSLPLNLQIDQLFPPAVPPPPSTYKSISYSQLPCSLPLNLQIDQLFPPAVPSPPPQPTNRSATPSCRAASPPSTYKSISYSSCRAASPSTYK